MSKATTFRFSKKFLERMDKEADKRGLTRTAFVRVAIENEIQRDNKTP